MKDPSNGSLGIHHFFRFFWGRNQKIVCCWKKTRFPFRRISWVPLAARCWNLLSEKSETTGSFQPNRCHQVIFKRWHNATPSISQVCEFLFFKDPHRKFGTKKRHRKADENHDTLGLIEIDFKTHQLVRGSLNLRPTWKKSCYHGNLRAPHPMLAYFSQKIRPMLRGLLRDDEG